MLGPVRKLGNAKRWEEENKVGNFSGRVILGPCACHKADKGKVEGWKERIYESNIPRNRILQYTFLILVVYSEGSFDILWRLRRLFGISGRLSIHLVDFGRPFSILRRSRWLIGILPQYTLNNLVDCSIFLGDPWVTLWYTWETPYTHSYTEKFHLGNYRIVWKLRIYEKNSVDFTQLYSKITRSVPT